MGLQRRDVRPRLLGVHLRARRREERAQRGVVEVRTGGRSLVEELDRSLAGDQRLLAAARNARGKYKKGQVVEGVLGSSEIWNSEIDRIERFHEQFGTTAYPVGMHSPGFIAETDEEAKEPFYPGYKEIRDRIGALRGSARWKTIGAIVSSWLVTLPLAGLIAALCWLALR